LCARDPCQALAIDHGKSHQLAARFREPVKQRLGNIDDSGGAEIAQPEGDKLGRQHVVAVLSSLPNVAATGEIGEEAMRRAPRYREVVRDARHGGAFSVRR
jgi:hypothetical protein